MGNGPGAAGNRQQQRRHASPLLNQKDVNLSFLLADPEIPKAEHGKTEDAPSEPGLEPKLTDVVAGWKSLIDVVSKFHVFGS